MAMTRLPAFPLITVDPSFTIWSPADKLYDASTVLWCNTEKKLLGKLFVNGKAYRFMGLGDEEIIPQADVKVEPLKTTYTFDIVPTVIGYEEIRTAQYKDVYNYISRNYLEKLDTTGMSSFDAQEFKSHETQKIKDILI